MYRNTYLEIREDHLLHNIQYLQSRSNKRLISIVKANGYGAIDFCLARVAEKAGVELFGVSSLSEAMNLRKHGIKNDILILSYVEPKYIPLLKENNLSFVTISFDYLKGIEEHLKDLKLHIKIDTGLNRLGVSPNEAQKTLDYLLEHGAKVEGIMTHYAMSDEPESNVTALQYSRFEKVVKELNFPFKFIHSCNTDAAVNFEDKVSSHVRCGIGLLGYSSYPTELKPSISLKSEIINVKKVNKGEGVGYGHRYISNGEGWVVLVSIGYADGFFKRNVGRFVYIDGEYAQIIGSVCMDQMMVLCKEYHPIGTAVELIGEHIPLEKVASELGIITYEVLTGITDRVTRLYKKDADTVTVKCNTRFSEEEIYSN